MLRNQDLDSSQPQQALWKPYPKVTGHEMTQTDGRFTTLIKDVILKKRHVHVQRHSPSISLLGSTAQSSHVAKQPSPFCSTSLREGEHPHLNSLLMHIHGAALWSPD